MKSLILSLGAVLALAACSKSREPAEQSSKVVESKNTTKANREFQTTSYCGQMTRQKDPQDASAGEIQVDVCFCSASDPRHCDLPKKIGEGVLAGKVSECKVDSKNGAYHHVCTCADKESKDAGCHFDIYYNCEWRADGANIEQVCYCDPRSPQCGLAKLLGL